MEPVFRSSGELQRMAGTGSSVSSFDRAFICTLIQGFQFMHEWVICGERIIFFFGVTAAIWELAYLHEALHFTTVF
jgi:hypothetical protein